MTPKQREIAVSFLEKELDFIKNNEACFCEETTSALWALVDYINPKIKTGTTFKYVGDMSPAYKNMVFVAIRDSETITDGETYVECVYADNRDGNRRRFNIKNIEIL